MIVAAIFFIPRKTAEGNPKDFITFQKEVDAFFIPDTILKYKNKNTSISETPAERKRVSVPMSILELNSADSASLVKLSGIGPVFSSRIIKYRNLLGGYYHIHQLKEVYGLNEEAFDRIKDQLRVESGLIEGISPDTSGFRVLARHPYIGREKAWQIINLRKKLNYASLSSEDLTGSIFDSVQWKKVKPYFIFVKNAKETD